MSRTLLWEPVIERGKSASDELKFLLRERFGEPVEVELDERADAFLQGVRLATPSAALKAEVKSLLAAIAKHGKIRFWEE